MKNKYFQNVNIVFVECWVYLVKWITRYILCILYMILCIYTPCSIYFSDPFRACSIYFSDFSGRRASRPPSTIYIYSWATCIRRVIGGLYPRGRCCRGWCWGEVGETGKSFLVRRCCKRTICVYIGTEENDFGPLRLFTSPATNKPPFTPRRLLPVTPCVNKNK